MPSREFNSSNPPSLISADLKIDGNLTCEGAIQNDGVVNGDINSNSLTLGEGAEVDGVVTADDVTVHGTMRGEIRSHTVHVMGTAKLTGDIVHQVLSVEAGAQIEGQVRRMEQARDTARVQKLQTPASSGKAPKMPPMGATTNGSGESAKPN